MTAPAYGAVGTRTQVAAGTSRAPALPAGRANGDVLIAICGSKNNAAHSIAGTGWAALTPQVDSGTGWTVSLWYRIVDGAEAAPTISWTGSVACFAQIIRYTRAPAEGSPFGAIGTAGTGTTSPHAAPGITTTQSNSTVVYIGAAAANTGYGAVSGWTERADNGSATGASRNVIGEKAVAAAGTTTGATSATGANAAWVQWQIEITEPLVTATGTGNGSAAGSAEAAVSVSAAASGNTSAAGGAIAAVSVSAAASGSVSATGDALAAVSVLAAGDAAGGPANGAAAAAVTVSAAASGAASATGGAVATVSDGAPPHGMVSLPGRWSVWQIGGRWQAHMAVGHWSRRQIEGQWQVCALIGRWARRQIEGRWR
jgi:hypothetical protein